MKFWLLVFFLTPQGDFVNKREIAHPDATSCYKAMKQVRKPKGTIVHTMCISDDHYMGLKQDPGVDYD